MKNPLRPGDLPYVAFLPALIQTGVWAAEQRVTTADDWAANVQAFPSWLVWFYLGFLAAILAMEPLRPSSRLRWALAKFGRLFDVESVSPDQPNNAPIRREATARLRFVRDLKNAELRIWGLIPNGHAPFLVQHETGLNIVKGDLRAFPLATISIHDGSISARFGGLAGMQTFHTGEHKKVVLEIRCGWRRQRETFDVIVRPISNQNHIELLVESGGPYRWAVP